MTKYEREQQNLVIREMANEGLTQTAIAEELGLDQSTVSVRMKKMGLRIVRHSRFTDEEEQEILRLYAIGLGATDIIRSLGRIDPQHTVYPVLARHGVRTRRPSMGSKAPIGATYRTPHGYIYERVGSDWSFSGKMRGPGGNGLWIAQHRKVMAESLGRALTKQEQVHHKDGDRSNNKLENLQLRQGAHGSGASFRCQTCGSYDVEPVSLA